MSFTFLFYSHIMFRHSCGRCHYANTRRPSDITLADFWGWEKVNPKFNKDDKGVSLVLINTEKGQRLFEAVKDNMNTFQVNIAESLQPNLQHPSEIHPRRLHFEKEFERYGMRYIMSRYSENGWLYQMALLSQRIRNRVAIILRKLHIKCG